MGWASEVVPSSRIQLWSSEEWQELLVSGTARASAHTFLAEMSALGLDEVPEAVWLHCICQLRWQLAGCSALGAPLSRYVE
jgi:hypothetical protein